MKLKTFAFLGALIMVGKANAAWELQQSQLDFVTTKITVSNQSVSEIGTFKDVTGEVSDDGKLTLKINPLSVDTAVEIRDGRLKDWVFAAQDYAFITLTGNIDLNALKDLPAGGLKTLTTDLTLTIRDKEQPVKVNVNVVRDDKNGFYVNLARPFFVDTSLFGLDEGVAKLTDVAKLGLITNQIPVIFNGHFVGK